MGLENFKERLRRINQFDGNLVYGARKFHSETHRIGPRGPASGFMFPEHAQVVEALSDGGYLRKGGFWESVKVCPVCGDGEREPYVERMGLSFHRCRKCTHVFQDPVVKPEVASKLYAEEMAGVAITTSKFQVEMESLSYKYGLDIFDFIGLPGRQKILDVGCGTGQFLRIAYREGWAQCNGIDSNIFHQSRFEKNAGIQYFSGSFDSISVETVGGDYDGVTMWNSLEHTYSVVDFLVKLRGVMRSGALICVMVPNVNSLATRLIRDKSPCYTWQHVHCFSPKSLCLLMERGGFKKEHLETVVTEIDNIKSYMSGEHPYNGYGDPEGLFDFICPEYIHQNLLGSRILAVFRC